MIFLLPVDFMALTAFFTSIIFAIPVEIIIGFFLAAAYFIKGMSVRSPDAFFIAARVIKLRLRVSAIRAATGEEVRIFSPCSFFY